MYVWVGAPLSLSLSLSLIPSHSSVIQRGRPAASHAIIDALYDAHTLTYSL
jgi:hypothetical protein